MNVAMALFAASQPATKYEGEGALQNQTVQMQEQVQNNSIWMCLSLYWKTEF